MHETNLLEDQPIAWTPTPEVIERAQLTRFMKQVGVSTWDELYAYSIRDVEKFTEEVLKFLDIKFDPPYEKLMDVSEGVEFPKWFRSDPPALAEGQKVDSDSTNWPPAHAGGSDSAGLNITTMCLDRWQTDEMRDQPAVIWESEEGICTTLTYDQLLRDVEKCVAGLKAQGLTAGDAIGIHLPMIPETIIALLAINRMGAIAVPVFSGYGVEAIVSRMNAVQAKAIFTTFGFPRRGKLAQSHGAEAAGKCPSVETVFVVNYKASAPPRPLRRDETVDEFRSRVELLKGKADPKQKLEDRQRSADPSHTSISFGISDIQSVPIEHPSKLVTWDSLNLHDTSSDIELTSAEDPLIVLYTSGTTGKPKGIAHTHASFPIKAAQDMAFGTDVGKGTRISWYTDIGWMMGPWLIYGALINGATICIYDGAPDYPTPDRMWQFCSKHKVEVLGISPTLIRSLAASENLSSPPSEGGVAPASGDGVVLSPTIDSTPFERHDLSSLRIFASTGEPWNPAPWWWLFEKVGNSKLPIINYSGGTEISGGILMGNPLLPIKPCSFPAPCPGMDVDILDEEGNSVAAGKVGELVIKQPWIGMARGFWQEKERYLDTYWRRFKDIWVHGDFAMRDKDGHWFILGRSDDTLKVAGKRVGPAEVESLLVAHPLVVEAAVIGVPDEVKGTAMVAFVVLSEPGAVATGLDVELKALVAKDMGKPLAPSKIHFVSAIPKTRNAKVMRRVIRSAYLGEDPGDLSALENPGSVDAIREVGNE